MNRLTIKQTQYINRIAEVHEAELERQNTTYKRTKLSVALRIEMIEHGLSYSTFYCMRPFISCPCFNLFF